MYLWRRFNCDTSSLRPAKRLNVYLLLFSAPGLLFRQRQVNIYLGGGGGGEGEGVGECYGSRGFQGKRRNFFCVLTDKFCKEFFPFSCRTLLFQ